MGIFDIFTNDAAKNAATDQISGINQGYNLASGNINQGIDAITTNYTKALQPYLQNYGTANAGVGQLTNLLGITGSPAGTIGSSPSGAPVSAPGTPTGGVSMPGGPAGGGAGPSTASTIMQTLQNTPGYQFQKQQGDDAVNAYAAATGKSASGNQLLDLSKFNQGLADTTYQQAVQNLMPFLGASQNAAGGIANVSTGQGNALAGQYDTLANLGWQKGTGIGNANANADLAANNASGNIWNMIGQVGKTAASALPFIMSDERLKEDIEPVGELYDGTNVYRYRYVGSMTPHIGLMAQEVEKVNPDAVVEIGGYKAVDYRKATQFASELSRFLEAA